MYNEGTIKQGKLPLAQSKTRAKKNKLFTVLVVLSMLGNTYVVPFMPFITFGEVALLFACVVLLVSTEKFYLNIPTGIGIFIAYSIVISFSVSIVLNSFEDALFRIVRDLFYWILIVAFGHNFFDFTMFRKGVKIFCLLLSAFIFLQVGVYYLTGFLVPGLLPGGMIDSSTNGQAVYDHILFWVGHAGYLKPNGFLSEASHSAQCLFIGAIFVLYDGRKMSEHYGKLLTILFFLAASVLTFSASAVIYCVFVGVLVLMNIIKENYAKGFATILIIIFLGIAVLLNMGLVSIVNRVLNAFAGGADDGSAFIRIYKGFEVWGNLPGLYKFFGIGFGNYVAVSNTYLGIELESEFMSTFSYLLVSTGIIGVFVILAVFVKLFIKCDVGGRVMIIALFVMSMAASVYSTPFWVWSLFWIFNSKKKNSVEGENVCTKNY